MVTNPRTPAPSLWDDGLVFGRDYHPEQPPREVLDLLHVNNSNSFATMVTHGIDILTGDVPEGSASVGAGEIRIVREEAA